MACRRFSGRHQLLRVLVAQFIEREVAALGDVERRVEKPRRIELGEALERTQMTLAVRIEREPRGSDRCSQANGREHVLQGAPPAHVHVNVAARDAWHFEFGAQMLERRQPAPIVAGSGELHGKPQPSRETLAQPAAFTRIRPGARQPEQKTTIERAIEIGAREQVAAFAGRAPATRDEACQSAP